MVEDSVVGGDEIVGIEEVVGGSEIADNTGGGGGSSTEWGEAMADKGLDKEGTVIGDDRDEAKTVAPDGDDTLSCINIVQGLMDQA